MCGGGLDGGETDWQTATTSTEHRRASNDKKIASGFCSRAYVLLDGWGDGMIGEFPCDIVHS
jgi:hypothetical protein